jgi:nucleotide-binding universal stress UspA family protein
VSVHYRRILVPVDGSDLAARALPEADRMARLFGAELHVLRVVADLVEKNLHHVPEALVGQVAAYTEQFVNQEIQRVNAQQSEVAAGLSRDVVRVVPVVIVGDPATAILDYAESAEIDLIVMSTHGRTGVSRMLYGSVAERVLHSARCPVLIVRAPAA